ncbi:MAG: hypothetical protein JW762_00010 [Dehalococcoidales bacterium]|nr:hypothetical protein [Dehalococcoidales bacterium]
MAAGISLINNHTPPVSGALGVIGDSGRASQERKEKPIAHPVLVAF